MNGHIQPYRIEIAQADIDHLNDRLASARWPGELPGTGWERGVPLGYLTELASYWRTGYDWRAAEAKLNTYPQFTTEIDGQRIHFLHVTSGQPGAKPLLITHGYPSSVAEFLHLIEPLASPAEGQAFHVVASSLPGYGFSTPLATAGWTIGRTARAWAELMRRLGYQRYGVHGGDIGAGVSGMVHRLRRQRRPHPLRAGALIRLGSAGGRAAGVRGVRCRRDGAQAGPSAGRRALE